jgi:hypothetical protein
MCLNKIKIAVDFAHRGHLWLSYVSQNKPIKGREFLD